MGKPLLIVESATKAQTIQRLLRGAYEVVASLGHVRDLPERGLGVRIEKVANAYQFIPTYQPLAKKAAIIRKIQEAVLQASQVYLATDEDREGEAIAWHLCEMLGIDGRDPVRIAFHEITRRALEEALAHPRPLNFHLINAQQARRVLDRIVGYQISPLLWRIFPNRRQGRSALSAGRVQSVALRLLVEREREIAAFQPVPVLAAEVEVAGNPSFRAALILPAEIPSLEEGQRWLSQMVGHSLRVVSVQKKPRRRGPAPPFTTSTLQQEAQRRLGFSLSRTMRAAQNLYEKGFITYMRTDSVHLAPEALQAIHAVLQARFGTEMVVARSWEDKKALHAQEAHEAIRPTDPSVEEAGDTPDEKKLYTLIWRRTLASQMADAIYEETVAHLEPVPATHPLLRFEAKGRILTQPGFLALYGYTSEEEEEGTLPPLTEGMQFEWTQVRLWEKFPSPPPRYTEGTLVRELEARGIGRPSTYAPTVETLLKRRYAERGEVRMLRPPYTELRILPDGTFQQEKRIPPPDIQKNKLLPTPLGIQVTDFLVARFPDIMDYDFTARIEAELDQIASEKYDWQSMLNAFYVHFTQELEKATVPDKRTRLLGKDPLTQKPVYLHFGRKGAYVALGEKDDPEQRTASVPPQISPDIISLEKALELLSFPRTVGFHENQPIEVRQGPYGYYIRWAGKNFSLLPQHNPPTLSESEAIEAIQAQQNTASTVLRSFPEAQIEVLQGRYGPYLKYPGGTRSLPKGMRVEELTLEKCEELLRAPRRSTFRKTVRKKS